MDTRPQTPPHRSFHSLLLSRLHSHTGRSSWNRRRCGGIGEGEGTTRPEWWEGECKGEKSQRGHPSCPSLSCGDRQGRTSGSAPTRGLPNPVAGACINQEGFFHLLFPPPSKASVWK